jgi:hypothetical protein
VERDPQEQEQQQQPPQQAPPPPSQWHDTPDLARVVVKLSLASIELLGARADKAARAAELSHWDASASASVHHGSLYDAAAVRKAGLARAREALAVARRGEAHVRDLQPSVHVLAVAGILGAAREAAEEDLANAEALWEAAEADAKRAGVREVNESTAAAERARLVAAVDAASAKVATAIAAAAALPLQTWRDIPGAVRANADFLERTLDALHRSITAGP